MEFELFLPNIDVNTGEDLFDFVKVLSIFLTQGATKQPYIIISWCFFCRILVKIGYLLLPLHSAVCNLHLVDISFQTSTLNLYPNSAVLKPNG